MLAACYFPVNYPESMPEPLATKSGRFAYSVTDVKPVEDIRRANLLSLIDEAGSPAKLASATGVPAPYISQVSRGVVRQPGGKPRVMGPDIARKLETKMGKPVGWMDADHSALSIASDLNGREGQLIGLFRLLNELEQTEVVNEMTRRLKKNSPRSAGADDGTRPKLKH